jgi:acyl-CoA thioester hydrolase
MFEKTLIAGWGDMDFNSHMRNTAFLDKSADVRMMFFAENGFPMDEFMRCRIGPVVMRDEVEYFKEVHLLAPLRVTLMLAGMAVDGSRFAIRNEFWNADNKLTARVTSTAGWLDLSLRKLIVPPEALHAAFMSLARTDDFSTFASSIKPTTE